jgi:hypothetical protein
MNELQTKSNNMTRITIQKNEMNLLRGKGNCDLEVNNNIIKVFRNNDVFAVGGFHRWLKRDTEDWKAIQKGMDLFERGNLTGYEKLLFLLYRIESKIFGN